MLIRLLRKARSQARTCKAHHNVIQIRKSSDLVQRVAKVIMASNPHVTALEDLPTSEAKWIELKKAKYIDAKGKERVWEVARRKTTGKAGVDAVAMGNVIYHPSKPPSTVVVLQFRPPINSITVEWPAGLVDADETPEEAAVREFKEETGYDGKVISVSPVVSADPGMTSATMQMCFIRVDLKGDEEIKQQLEEGEYIQCITIPLADLYDRLNEFSNKEGYSIAAKLYHFAAGVQFGRDNPSLFDKLD